MFAVAVSLAYYANSVKEERDDFPEGAHDLFDELSDTMSANAVSSINYTLIYNLYKKIYGENCIPKIALWCLTFINYS